MTRPDAPTPSAKRSPLRRLTFKPITLTAVGLVAAGLMGGAVLENTRFAFAETQTPTPTQVDPGQAAYPRATFSFADLAEKVKPSVVSINVRNGKGTAGEPSEDGPGGEGGGPQIPGLPDLPPDHPLNEFFKRFRDQQQPQQRPSQAQGSGFIVSNDGYVVTNNHVIDGAEEIKLTLDDGDVLEATLVGTDARTDIALLKIKDMKGKTLTPVPFSEKEARIGDWVLAVGNPFGLGGTVTAGIVSARNRDIGSGPYDYIQIDAAVNRGNSGGPTFDLEGKVVGVNTAIFSPSGGNVGIAFAVPATLVNQVVQQLKEKGTVSRGWLGVTIQNVNEDIANSIGLENIKGAMITGISSGGPAADADIKVGDVIIDVNGDTIDDSRDLARKVAELQPKAKVNIELVRDGDKKKVEMSLGTFPSGKQLAELEQGGSKTPDAKDESMKDLGLTLAPASRTPGAGDEGVVITKVDPSSDAAEKGLKPGDVILEVAGEPVSAPRDVTKGLDKAREKGRKAVLMRVKSGDQQRFVALPLKKA